MPGIIHKIMPGNWGYLYTQEISNVLLDGFYGLEYPFIPPSIRSSL